MAKYFSREFLIALGLIVLATIAMFVGLATFTEWTIACGGFLGAYITGKTVQKVKRSGKPKEGS